jgi:hypothetical protein
MKTYWIIAVCSLAIGLSVAGGATWYQLLAPREYFVPNNSISPLADSGPHTAQASDGHDHAHVLVENGERFHFGRMNRGAKMKHTFYFRNVGLRPLTLEIGEASCKCTISKLDRDSVMPGEVVPVTLEWEAKTGTAEFRQVAEIKTNDPEHETVRLQIEGYVDEALRLVPDALRFVNVSGNEPVTRTIHLFGGNAEDAVEILHHELTEANTAKYFEVDIRDATEQELASQPRAKFGKRISVTLSPGMPTGEIRQQLRLQTSLPEASELFIPIDGNIVSDISVLGRGGIFQSRSGLLTLGPVKSAEGASVELLILVKGPHRESIQFEVAEIDPPNGLQVTLGEAKVSEKMVTYPLRVDVPRGAPTMSRLGTEQGKLGTILLKTTHSLTKEIPIRVRFAVN